MGWLATIGDLESILIPVSPGQRDVLVHGGEVLVLQGLPDPGNIYCGCGAFHQCYDGTDGSPVMIAAVMRSYPAFDVCPPVYPRPAGIETFDQLLDEYHDEDAWRFWPSYTGHLTNAIDVMTWEAEFSLEEPRVQRVWAGIPVSEIGEEMAREIMTACNTRVEATPWFYIQRMYGYAEEGFPTMEEIEADDRGDYEDFTDAIEVLEKCGLWDREEHDVTTMLGADLVFSPLEMYLSPAAQEVWGRLNDGARTSSRKARRTIRKGELNVYDFREKEFDPWV